MYMKTSEEIVETANKIISEADKKIDALMLVQCKLVLKWFRSKFPHRKLEWVDGMGTGYWMLDGDILDFSEEQLNRGYFSNTNVRYSKVLKPLVEFEQGFFGTALSAPPSIGRLNSFNLGKSDKEFDNIRRVCSSNPKASILQGTSSFETYADAVVYYTQLGYDRQEIKRLCDEESFSVGIPSTKSGKVNILIHCGERRYYIETEKV